MCEILAILIFTIVTVILNVFILYRLDKSKCSCNHTSNFEEPERYTRDEILNKWTLLNSACARIYPPSPVVISKALRMSKASADLYLDGVAKNNLKTCYKLMAIPVNVLDQFVTIWGTSNCPVEFPLRAATVIYSNKKGDLTKALKEFNIYVNNLKKNIESNDDPFEDLKVSFTKCYGAGWDQNPEILAHYDAVNAMT